MKTHKRLPKALLPHPRHKGSIVRNQVHGELNRQFEHQEVVLLVGMPAIGKTTCAVQYAESHVGTQYDHLIWLNLQQHPYELATTLALRLAEHTDRHITPKIDHQNCEQHLTSLLLQCSGATDGKLLLVLDHFTQSLFTDDVLHTTVLGDQWDILVVCTHPDDLPGFPSVMVPSLTLEESVSLFGSGYQGCETATSYNDIKELCTLLEGHPFVIVLYANLLSANPELTVQKLIHHVQLRAISPDFISRINTHYDKIKQKKEEVSLLHILKNTFLNQLALTPIEIDVLKLFCLLPERYYRYCELKKFVIPDKNYPFLLSDALESLSQKGLISKVGDCFKCPEVIKLVVYLTYWVDSHDIQNAVQVIISGLEYESAAEFKEQIKYLQICEYLLRFTFEQHALMAKLYHALNELYDTLGDHTKAVYFVQKELNVLSLWPQADEPQLADAYNRLGVSYLYTQQYLLSFEHLKKALELKIKIYGYQHYLTGRTIMNMAALYVSTSNVEAGHAYLDEAERILTEDVCNAAKEKDLFHLYNLKGEAYCVQRAFDLALTNYTKALTLIDEWTGHKEPDMHMCYEKIALCHLQSGKATDAEEWALKSLQLKLELLGDGHPYVGDAHYVMAILQKKEGLEPLAQLHFDNFSEIYHMNGMAGNQVFLDRCQEFLDVKKNEKMWLPAQGL
jgi:tetratricopeptide (TPR) repeat protein